MRGFGRNNLDVNRCELQGDQTFAGMGPTGTGPAGFGQTHERINAPALVQKVVSVDRSPQD